MLWKTVMYSYLHIGEKMFGEAGKDVCQTTKYFISLENTMPSDRKNYFKITVVPGQPTLKGINIRLILFYTSQI